MKEMVGGCCVCSDERGWTENPLVYCDGQGCSVAVHQACYGIVTVPTGPWFCKKCESQERAARVKCELCPSKDGALKRTDTAGWAHVVCALYIPEVRFGNVTTMEPIILQMVPPDRFHKICYICEETGKEIRSKTGACMQCNKSGCKQNFHVTCAQAAGLLCEEAGNYMDNVKYCGYCQYHYQKLVSTSLYRHPKRKDNSIKTIPAFTPIPSADSITPESTPEKRSPLPASLSKPEVKLERIKNRAEKKHRLSSSSETNSNKSECSLQMSTGAKFTTANFTETVVTQSSGPLFASEKGRKSKKSSDSVYSFSSDSEQVNSDSNNVTKYGHSPGHDSDSAKDPTSDDATFSPKTTVCNNTSTSSQPSSVTFKSIFESYVNGNRQESIVESDVSSGSSNKKAKTEKIEKKKQKKIFTSKAKNKNIKDKPVSIEPRPMSPIDAPPSPPRKAKKRKESQILQNGFALSPSPHSPCGPTSPPHNGQSLLSNGPASSVPNNKPSAPSPPAQQPQVSPYSHVLAASNHISPSANTENNLPSNHQNHVIPPRLPASTSRYSSNSNINLNNQAPPPPHSLEQLLERQWEQGSQLLMEQSTHFDIASLLSCLNQLRSENQKLEEHVSSLIARRDHLLVVNARLSIPLNVPNSNQEARQPRINNFIPSDASVPENNAFNRGHRSPAAGSSVNNSHAILSHQSNLAPQHQSSGSSSGSHGSFIQPSLPSPGSLQRPNQHISNQQFNQRASPISQGPTLSYGLQNPLVPPTHHDIASSSSLLRPLVPLLLPSHQTTTADSPLLPPSPFSSDAIRQAINSQHAALNPPTSLMYQMMSAQAAGMPPPSSNLAAAAALISLPLPTSQSGRSASSNPSVEKR